MNLTLRGNENRTSSPTEANATSSRSHAILQINVIIKNKTGDVSEETNHTTLSIIDLANGLPSPRIVEQDYSKEQTSINLSLVPSPPYPFA